MILRSWESLQPRLRLIQSLERQSPGLSKWDEETWKRLFKNQDMFVTLKLQNEALKGFSVVSRVKDEAEILKIAVDGQYRRQGIGSELVKESISQLSTQKTKILHLEVRSDNDSATLFYEQLGFKLVGKRKRYYKDPICDALLYSLDLPTQ